jgi:hypothetical protein
VLQSGLSGPLDPILTALVGFNTFEEANEGITSIYKVLALLDSLCVGVLGGRSIIMITIFLAFDISMLLLYGVMEWILKLEGLGILILGWQYTQMLNVDEKESLDLEDLQVLIQVFQQ